MKADDLEQRMRDLPLRQLPAEWKGPILKAAREAALRTAGATTVTSSVFGWCKMLSNLSARLAATRHPTPDTRPALLWPCPRAWAGLAVVWAGILAFQWVSADTEPAVIAQDNAPPSPSLLQMVKEQRQRLAQLTGQWEAPAEPARAYRPKPKSERQLDWSFA